MVRTDGTIEVGVGVAAAVVGDLEQVVGHGEVAEFARPAVLRVETLDVVERPRPENLRSGQYELSPEVLKTLSLEMRRRFADGPQELRQAYMRLILERVTVDHDVVRLQGSPAVLERLANNGVSKSTPEVLSFVQEWRPREDSNLRPPV